VSRRRATDLVRIARRCPADRDRELARWAVEMTISQLDRILRSLPPVTSDDQPAREPERRFARWQREDGWVDGRFTLPPDEAALLDAALDVARDAEWRDRKDLEPDGEVDLAEAREVSAADAFVRLLSEGLDGMDAHFRRTGHRGERCQVILHREVRADGSLGPASLHQGDAVPESVARYLGCDADTLVQYAREGRLVGITPTERHPNRRLRRYLERRDGGCAHPLCLQRRFLHAHHLVHWEDGGPTTADNLLCLCPLHHRALHLGEYTIEGDPEARTVVFRDRWGRPIAPPDLGADPLPTPAPTSYVQPLGERLSARDFAWA
jgi:hypothetical protein